MKNLVRVGNSIAIPAPYDVESGEVVIINDLKGIAIISGSKDEEITIGLRGVYELDKVDESVGVGDRAYYREDLKLLTKQEKHIQGEGEIEHPLLGVFVLPAETENKKAQVLLV